MSKLIVTIISQNLLDLHLKSDLTRCLFGVFWNALCFIQGWNLLAFNFRHILEILEGKGPMTSTGIEALLFMKTNNSIDPDLGYPDIEILQSFATVAFDTCKFLFSFTYFSYTYFRKIVIKLLINCNCSNQFVCAIILLVGSKKIVKKFLLLCVERAAFKNSGD